MGVESEEALYHAEETRLLLEDSLSLNESINELRLLLNYNPELPDQLLLGGFTHNEDGQEISYKDYKFRGSWFQGALSAILLVADLLGATDLYKAALQFQKEKRAKVNQKTTREEIEFVDRLIQRALALSDS